MEAAEAYKPTIRYRLELDKQESGNLNHWNWLVESYQRLADFYEAPGQEEQFIDTLKGCIGHLNQMRMLVDEEDYPAQASASSSIMLLITYIRLGNTLSSVGQKDDAHAQFDLAGKVLLAECQALEEKLDVSRYSPDDLETLIWQLNHFPLPEYRNAKLASSLSRKVSETNQSGILEIETYASGVAATQAE